MKTPLSKQVDSEPRPLVNYPHPPINLADL